jgi:thymidylate synthase
MHANFFDVNQAFNELVKMFSGGPGVLTFQGQQVWIDKSSSRVGDVWYIMDPVILTYQRPKSRVLLNIERDANPFFHLFEALWMLSGRNLIRPLQHFSSKIGDFCSDDGFTANGAYGHRWRHGTVDYQSGDQVDQIEHLIKHMRAFPETRRAVLQMWNTQDDLMRVDGKSHPDAVYSKDVCCNTSAMFSIGRSKFGRDRVLDMTVTNRSNDLILGCLGANYVHFSILQEYIATALGIGVGVYNQMSNNLHVYTTSNGGFHPERWLKGKPEHIPEESPMPLFHNKEQFDNAVDKIVDLFTGPNLPTGTQLTNSVGSCPGLIDSVVIPMLFAYLNHKDRLYTSALLSCEMIEHEQWRVAARQWITTRKERYEAKTAGADEA